MTTDNAARDSPAGVMLAASVCKHYGQLLHRYLLRRLRDIHSTRDLEQEVYLRLLRVGTGEFVRDPQSYMYRIAANVVYEYRQREHQQPVIFDSNAVTEWDRSSDPASEDPLGEQLDHRRNLQAALERVPPRWRAAFILHTRDGMTYAEIAKELNIAVPTVKKYVTQSFMALREDVKRDTADGGMR